MLFSKQSSAPDIVGGNDNSLGPRLFRIGREKTRVHRRGSLQGRSREPAGGLC